MKEETSREWHPVDVCIGNKHPTRDVQGAGFQVDEISHSERSARDVHLHINVFRSSKFLSLSSSTMHSEELSQIAQFIYSSMSLFKMKANDY